MSEHANRLRKMRVLLPGLIGVDASPDDDAALDAGADALDEVARLRAELAESIERMKEMHYSVVALKTDLAAAREREGALRQLRDRVRPGSETAPWVCDEIDRILAASAEPAAAVKAGIPPSMLCPHCGKLVFGITEPDTEPAPATCVKCGLPPELHDDPAEFVPASAQPTCPECGGSGYTEDFEYVDGVAVARSARDCPACKGARP